MTGRMSVGRKDNTELWENFQRRHPGNRFLNQDPLYSLPINLIDNINNNIKGFFSKDDLKFELDLANITGDGFFLKNNLRTGLSHHNDKPNAALLSVANEIRKILTDAKRESQEDFLSVMQKGRSKESIKSALDKKYNKGAVEVGVNSRPNINRRSRSYIGWLCTNPEYLFRVGLLKSAISDIVMYNGGFYTYSLGLKLQSHFSDIKYRSAYRRLKRFYSAWNLDTFYTWDIPSPVKPSFTGGLPYGPRMKQTGIHIFLPWYSVNGRILDVDNQIKDIERLHLNNRFISYFEAHSSKSHSYHEHMFLFYRYFYLVLYKRYRDRLVGSLEKIDMSFKGIIGGPDSAARIRKDFCKKYREFGIMKDL